MLITKKRNKSVDICKGIMILLVVIGHIIPGTLDKNLVRYIIYSFHMPLFIGLSGYMFNIQKVKQVSFLQILKKYWGRLIIPWLIAVNIYFLYSLIGSFISHESYGMLDYLKAYFHP